PQCRFLASFRCRDPDDTSDFGSCLSSSSLQLAGFRAGRQPLSRRQSYAAVPATWLAAEALAAPPSSLPLPESECLILTRGLLQAPRHARSPISLPTYPLQRTPVSELRSGTLGVWRRIWTLQL
ncbi:hypothetical protein H1C71_032679, partial [Ictidomys tridecemlineatus]